MELIDTHSHLTFEGVVEDLDAVLQKSRQAGIRTWLTVGTDLHHSRECVQLAEKYPDIYAAVGIHPHDAKDLNAGALEELEQLARNPKVVAIGETGLDFFKDYSPRKAQRRAFAAQIKISRELNLPLIIHSREAFGDTLDVLDRHGPDLEKVVFHCFSGSANQSKTVIEKGWHISFTGVITFNNAEKTRQAAQAVPIERLMLETDCPFMSPEPVRKQKINEPALMIHTAGKLAELKNISLEHLAVTTTETAKSFFNLP